MMISIKSNNSKSKPGLPLFLLPVDGSLQRVVEASKRRTNPTFQNKICDFVCNSDKIGSVLQHNIKLGKKMIRITY